MSKLFRFYTIPTLTRKRESNVLIQAGKFAEWIVRIVQLRGAERNYLIIHVYRCINVAFGVAICDRLLYFLIFSYICACYVLSGSFCHVIGVHTLFCGVSFLFCFVLSLCYLVRWITLFIGLYIVCRSANYMQITYKLHPSQSVSDFFLSL